MQRVTFRDAFYGMSAFGAEGERRLRWQDQRVRHDGEACARDSRGRKAYF